jgi:hypothetical protein
MVDPNPAVSSAQTSADSLSIAPTSPAKAMPIAAGYAFSSGGSLPATPRVERLEATPDVSVAAPTVAQSRQVEIFGRNEGPYKLLSGTGPITREMWEEPKQILGKLTQWSRQDPANEHCVGCDLLAGAIIHGRETTAKYLEKIASYGKGFLTDEHVGRLAKIAASVRAGTATFEDLGVAQDITYRAMDREMIDNPDSVQIDNGSGKQLTASELTDISNKGSQELGVDVTAAVKPFGSHHIVMLNYNREHPGPGDGLDPYDVAGAASTARLNLLEMAYDRSRTDAAQAIMDQLGRGECATVLIEYPVAGGMECHCILFGKYPDGSPYIYNSHPTNGQATMIVAKPGKSNDEFKAELARYDQGIKRVIKEGAWFPTKLSYKNL